MRWFFKKWRVLRKLRKECIAHTNINNISVEQASQGVKVVVSRRDFIKKSAGRTVKRVAECESLIDDIKSDGLILETPEGGLRLSLAGENYYGYLPFLEKFLTTYPSAWRFVIVPVVTFIVGAVSWSYLREAWDYSVCFVKAHIG